jgi:hypothetical protein
MEILKSVSAPVIRKRIASNPPPKEKRGMASSSHRCDVPAD